MKFKLTAASTNINRYDLSDFNVFNVQPHDYLGGEGEGAKGEIEVNSLEELIALSKKTGQDLVIFTYDEVPELMIYDGYIE